MGFIKKHVVAVIAVLAAVISSCFVLPDKEYLSYFDTRVLMSLFCFIAVITAFEITGVFRFIAEKSISYFVDIRRAVFGLVFLTAIFSMFVSNDIALLTMLPLTYMILKETDNLDLLAYLFTLETVAANLGGMLLPFGSPQNIFLFSYFEIPFKDFIEIMWPPFLVSTALIFLFCCFVSNRGLPKIKTFEPTFDKPQLISITVLFLLALTIILRITPVYIGLIIPLILFFVCRPALLRLDWELLLVFTAFFVFAGNIGRLDFVQEINVDIALTAVVGSQVISNVPTAILLAQTTEDFRSILLGTNIGGVGTLVASLANLIAYSKYREYLPGDDKKFLGIFSGVNFFILFVLIAIFMIVF